MNAALKPIEVRPIVKPNYCNRNVRDFAGWLADNQQALVDYWNSLVTADGLGPLGEDDHFLFCVVQHEREMDRMEELRRCYKNYGDNR